MENKQQEEISTILKRIPKNILSNPNLEFKIEEDKESHRIDVLINIKSKSDSCLAILNLEKAEFKGTEYCDIAREDYIYCNKSEYIKEIKFDKNIICPSVSDCDDVKACIQSYNSEYKQ